MTPPPLTVDGPADAALTVALAHGAGAGMDSEFMNTFAQKLAGRGLRVVRFEFPYMQARRAGGARRPPNPAPVLIASWHSVIAQLDPGRLVIGGKSLGGRIASMIADEAGVRGLVCLGYPFHAPGKPSQPRIEHLGKLVTPTLICQGERDPFGNADEIRGYSLSRRIAFHWLADGDHGFKPRKASGRSEQQNRADAVDAIVAFTATLVAPR